MSAILNYKEEIVRRGFTIIPGLYGPEAVAAMTALIETTDSSSEAFRKTSDLFAIRQVLKTVPGLPALVFNDSLIRLVRDLFGNNFFAVKSIYFDKPETSNWYVAYHQDMTISVDKKAAAEGFGPWIARQDQFAVQPPTEILENIFTVRIHLDATDDTNGALKVIEGSHAGGIRRAAAIDLSTDKEVSCHVPSGGIMIMKPLLLHSSARSTGNRKRRVIHIEFSDCELPANLNWSERMDLPLLPEE